MIACTCRRSRSVSSLRALILLLGEAPLPSLFGLALAMFKRSLSQVDIDFILSSLLFSLLFETRRPIAVSRVNLFNRMEGYWLGFLNFTRSSVATTLFTVLNSTSQT